MGPFQNCVRHPCPAFKMAAVTSKKNGDLKNGFLRNFFWRFIDVKQTIVIIGSAHLYILS